MRDGKHETECKLHSVEAALSEARKQVGSMEETNRILLDKIAPAEMPAPPPATAASVEQPVVQRPSSPVTADPVEPLTPVASNDLAPSVSSHEPPCDMESPSVTLPREEPPPAHSNQRSSPPPQERDADCTRTLMGKKLDILFVGNSQFRYMDKNKILSNVSCATHVLSDKTLNGAAEFFEHYKPATSPLTVCIQVISNTLENTLNPNATMNNLVGLISTITRHCPNTQIAVGVPLPRLCATPDLTRRYDMCRDQVEERLKNLAAKRHNVVAVWSRDLGAYSEELFSDNKHLSHIPMDRRGGRTGIGLLMSAFKAAISPLLPATTRSQHDHHPTHQNSNYPKRWRGRNDERIPSYNRRWQTDGPAWRGTDGPAWQGRRQFSRSGGHYKDHPRFETRREPYKPDPYTNRRDQYSHFERQDPYADHHDRPDPYSERRNLYAEQQERRSGWPTPADRYQDPRQDYAASDMGMYRSVYEYGHGNYRGWISLVVLLTKWWQWQ